MRDVPLDGGGYLPRSERVGSDFFFLSLLVFFFFFRAESVGFRDSRPLQQQAMMPNEHEYEHEHHHDDDDDDDDDDDYDDGGGGALNGL